MALFFAAVLISPLAHAEDGFNVRFSWKLKGEYAPFYLAQEKGLFTKGGLAVHLGEGAGAQAALGALIQGKEDVVVVPGIYALTAVSKGMPVKIVALYQPKAPLSITSHTSKPIHTPKDMEGKSLIMTVGDTTADYLKVFCKLNNVDCGKIKLLMLNVQARFPQFVSGQADALSTYWNTDLPQLEYTTKQKFVVLDVAKYGLVVPGLAVVASNTDIERKPERLKRFLHALGQGFEATNKHVLDASKALLRVWQGGPPAEVVERQVSLSNETFPKLPGKPMGWVQDEVITAALSLLKDSGQIEQAKSHETYYTNALLAN